MSHIPVLLAEILEASRDLNAQWIFDGTFGRGGHLRALLDRFPEGKAVAFDRDPQAIQYGLEHFASELAKGRVQLFHQDYRTFDWGTFKAFPGLQDQNGFDFMLLDLGVSSPQLDERERGFSFYQDGPLDMRMNTNEGVTAADILNTAPEDTLIRIFQDLGEVRKPFRVVKAIVSDRQLKSWDSTQYLAQMIERVDGWRIKGHHPATQYFMALRMAVNTELEAVQLGLRQCLTGLKEGGRLAVITFHSLEDRIVKNIFKSDLNGFCLNKKVIQASEEEVKINPRARSAKLRIFQKGKRIEKPSNKYRGSSSKYLQESD